MHAVSFRALMVFLGLEAGWTGVVKAFEPLGTGAWFVVSALLLIGVIAWDNRSRLRIWLGSMEPIHLVIAGFVGVLVFAVIGLFGAVWYLRTPLAEAASRQISSGASFNSDAFYIGQMGADLQHLSDDLYVEFWLKGFNGTGTPASIEQISGAITYTEIVNGQQITRGPLPPPRILDDRTPLKHVPPLREFMVVLEQRAPKAAAESISTALNEGRHIHIGFHGLDLIASNPSGQKARLPLWGSMSLRKMPDRIYADMVIELRVDAHENRSSFGGAQ